MDIKPCSRVFENDMHKPHTYYFGGHDVKCLGYSPMRKASSDEAETPEEFFGLDPVTKANRFSKTDFETILFEEECLEAQSKYGDQIAYLWELGLNPEQISFGLNLNVEIVYEIVKDMDLIRIEKTDLDDDEEFDISPLSLLAISAIVFLAISFIVHGIVC